MKGNASELYRWWSDYQDGEKEDNSLFSVHRKVLSKEANRAVLEDHFTRPFHFIDVVNVTLIPPHSVEFEGDSSIWKTRGRYTFTQSGDEAMVESVITLCPKHIWKILFSIPFVRYRVCREFQRDLEAHLMQFLSESEPAQRQDAD